MYTELLAGIALECFDVAAVAADDDDDEDDDGDECTSFINNDDNVNCFRPPLVLRLLLLLPFCLPLPLPRLLLDDDGTLGDVLGDFVGVDDNDANDDEDDDDDGSGVAAS